MASAASTWKRLGDLLLRRRIELDPAYANRRIFSEATGVNARTIADIEKGRRDNYEPATIASVEVAYRLAGGSVARTLAGGDLEPLPVMEPAPAVVAPPSRDDRAADPYPSGPAALAAHARAETADRAAAELLFPGDPRRQEAWDTLTNPSIPPDEKLALLAGLALFANDRVKAAIVAADIIGRERPAEMAAKIRVMDLSRSATRKSSGQNEKSA